METESTVPITPLSDVRDPCHNDDDDPIASLSVEADLIRLYAYSIGSNDPDPPRFSRDAPAQPSLSLSLPCSRKFANCLLSAASA